jgi:hypothetical protein
MKQFLNNKGPQNEAHLVIFFQALHAVEQPLFGRPLFHKFPRYLSNIGGYAMQDSSIIGKGQLSQLRQMFAAHPRQHLQNTSQATT